MTQTIKKSIGQGWGKGEVYHALAYDENDKFGGLRIKGIYIDKTAAIAGVTPLAFKSVLNVNNVEEDNICGAIYAYLDLKTSGSVIGLGSALCAEMIMMGSDMAVTSRGTYGVLELELGCPLNWAGSNIVSFIYAQVYGDTSGNFDDYGTFFSLEGVASGSAHLWYDKGTAITPGDASEWIRVRTPGGVRYLLLYDSPS